MALEVVDGLLATSGVDSVNQDEIDRRLAEDDLLPCVKEGCTALVPLSQPYCSQHGPESNRKAKVTS